MSPSLILRGTPERHAGAMSGTPTSSGTHNQPMLLEMIDWRGCPVVEYVPGRVSGKPSFLNCRMQVSLLVDWVNTGHSAAQFAEDFHMDIDQLMVAVEYLRGDPPVQVVDLTGCPVVELNPSGTPSFKGTHFPVEALFNFLKSGRTARDFSDTYNLDYMVEVMPVHVGPHFRFLPTGSRFSSLHDRTSVPDHAFPVGLPATWWGEDRDARPFLHFVRLVAVAAEPSGVFLSAGWINRIVTTYHEGVFHPSYIHGDFHQLGFLRDVHIRAHLPYHFRLIDGLPGPPVGIVGGSEPQLGIDSSVKKIRLLCSPFQPAGVHLGIDSKFHTHYSLPFWNG